MDALKIMHEVAIKVQWYCPGNLGWIAKQDDNERDDVYGFVIGNGFAHTTIEEAVGRKDDDTYIRELATQVLGYAPDSEQDLERRLNLAITALEELTQSKTMTEGTIGHFQEEQINLTNALLRTKRGLTPFPIEGH